MSDVSYQQAGKESDKQPQLESELNTPFLITDAKVKVQSDSNLESAIQLIQLNTLTKQIKVGIRSL